MFVILVYDVGVERVTNVMKLCRIYLNHVQNSVFEGDITISDLAELKIRLLNIIDPDHDSVIIFKFRSNKLVKRETLGVSEIPTNIIFSEDD